MTALLWYGGPDYMGLFFCISYKSIQKLYLFIAIWVFPKIGIPQNGWFIMENPIKMDDLGAPLFSETSISMLVDAACSLFQTRSANYVLCLLLEPCRLYLGYAGNLGEKVWASGH